MKNSVAFCMFTDPELARVGLNESEAKKRGIGYRLAKLPMAAVLRAVQANAELFRQYKGFADPVPVPQTAPVLDRALALSGRDPQWAPAG